ncbi:DUF2793 domain-containing protein [uncultured Methylobacterium sp.]|jgi:hypothetical protein|uniref:DUF2793 domain-containing protein n=1 Tax=uncultured Methylobacterium sp. TaxID=157278 RepID=UPI002635E9CD|nr:DUF2793 domain-containing protein [uncultured Methylobacterium sp.]
MSDATPRLALPLLAAAQAQKHVTHNEALTALDALVHLAVLDRTRAAPPANPVEGDRHLVTVSEPTGAWAGWAGRVACFQDGAWISYAPRPGWLAWVASEGALFVHDGAAWIACRPALDSLQGLTRLGLGTEADAQNPFAAKLNTALWTARAAAEGGSGDLRCTFNKEAPGNTLSLLFQSGWSGRAEIGLTGSDDLRLKVSADGDAWREALRVQRASGGVDFLAAETSLAAAATVDLGAAPTLKVAVTGNATVTSFGTGPNRVRLLRFTGAVTLTHDAAALVLPRNATLVAAAGDTCLAVSDAAGIWRVWHYQRASGKPLAGPSAAEVTDATATGRAALTAATPAALATAAGLGPGASPTFAGLALVGNAVRGMAVDGLGRTTWTYSDNALATVNTLANGGVTAAGHGIGWAVQLGRSVSGLTTAGQFVVEASGDYAAAAGQSSRWVLRAQAAGALVPALTLDPVAGHLSHHDWKPAADNARALGGAAARWSQLYAGTGTISTSDAREKTAVAPLTAAELAAAAELAREIGTFRFLAAIEAKGEAARHHVGLTVQRAMAILSGHGLDPFAYAFVCRDAWPASPGRPEIREAVRDEDGAPSGETRVVQEAEPPCPAGERLGFRADELALCLIRSQEARLAALETAAG